MHLSLLVINNFYAMLQVRVYTLIVLGGYNYTNACTGFNGMQFARMTSSSSAVAQETLSDVHEGSFSHVMNKDLYRQRNKIVGTCVCVCEGVV